MSGVDEPLPGTSFSNSGGSASASTVILSLPEATVDLEPGPTRTMGRAVFSGSSALRGSESALKAYATVKVSPATRSAVAAVNVIELPSTVKTVTFPVLGWVMTSTSSMSVVPLEEEVQRMLAEAKAADAEEDAHYGPARLGDELPEGLGGRRERLKRLKEAKERLQREAEAAAKAVQEHGEQRRAEEVATGKKKRGRKPKVVEPLPTEEAKANTTDPDSRIMKTRQGYVQGYNAQAVVSEEQIIVAVGVTQEANDVQQLEPMLQTMAHTLEAAGIEDRPKAGLADAGYWSEANIRACSWPEMPELLIATTKDWKQRKMLREKGCPRGRIPKGLSPRDRMERKLLTKRGRALYKKRGVLVEPVFGQVKEGQGFRRFMRRGLGAAQSEWSLAGTTHNLLKLWRRGQAPWGWALAPWT